MSVECFVCKGPVNPHDEGAWKQVIGWVHGKRKDGMTLRVDTGAYAHHACVLKLREGQAPDQDDIFAEQKENPTIRADRTRPDEWLNKELFDDGA